MNQNQINKLIKKQVSDDLKSRGMAKRLLTEAEYNKELYKVALDMLAEKKD